MVRASIALAAVSVVAACLAVPTATGRTDAPPRVGLVEWAGSATGTALGRQFHTGFVTAVRRLGLRGAVREVSPSDSPADALAFFARRDYDLIVMGAYSPRMLETTERVATAFPDSTFLVPDRPVGRKVTNVHGFVLRVEEASYLAGHLAAQVTRPRSGRATVGSIGGIATPPVLRFIAGFQSGARRAVPGVRTINGYSQDFNNPRKCRSLALDQIARGAGAIFGVAGACGEGALSAAKAEGVYGVGVDADHAFLGPHILTSVVLHYDVALLHVLRAFQDGTLPERGTSSLGLREGAVGLGKLSPRVPAALARRLGGVRARIVDGTIRVPTTLR